MPLTGVDVKPIHFVSKSVIFVPFGTWIPVILCLKMFYSNRENLEILERFNNLYYRFNMISEKCIVSFVYAISTGSHKSSDLGLARHAFCG